MTVIVDDLSPDGVVYVGEPGLGVTASQVPAEGEDGPSYLYDQVVALGLTTEEVYGEIVVWPTTGTFFAWEDGSFIHSGATESTSFFYQLYVNGVATGALQEVILDWDSAGNARIRFVQSGAWIQGVPYIIVSGAWVEAVPHIVISSAWVVPLSS